MTTKQEQKHTPTPWVVECFGGQTQVFSGRIKLVDNMYDEEHELPISEIEANAAFIVKAVNSFDLTVKALECIIVSKNHQEAIEYAKQMLCKMQD